MDTTETGGNWEEQKGKLEQQFSVLTNYEVILEVAMEELILRKLQRKMGMTKQELYRFIEEL